MWKREAGQSVSQWRNVSLTPLVITGFEGAEGQAMQAVSRSQKTPKHKFLLRAHKTSHSKKKGQYTSYWFCFPGKCWLTHTQNVYMFTLRSLPIWRLFIWLICISAGDPWHFHIRTHPYLHHVNLLLIVTAVQELLRTPFRNEQWL